MNISFNNTSRLKEVYKKFTNIKINYFKTKVTMKVRKKIISGIVIGTFLSSLIVPSFAKANNGDKVVYPLQEVSTLECRFEKFSDLTSKCKRKLPILRTKDYKKYLKQDGGFNEYTRTYTVLWGSSYKYGWDVGSGGHQWVDIATAQWTPVYAMADGKVIKAHSMLGWGKTVSIEHVINGKKIVSNYSHLHKIDTKEWKTVKSGQKIGEVGSTGNSTGNHLHFQIDLDTSFSPYYYNTKTCPHSYYDITEKWVCFDELERTTIDPLKFLEDADGVLENITIWSQEVELLEKKEKAEPVKQTTTVEKSSQDLSIFDRTVYTGYERSDIIKVSQIMKDLGYYNGRATSDYTKIEEAVIAYQLDKNIIQTRGEAGTGWFGPKTRTQAKKDYQDYLAGAYKAVAKEEQVVKNTTNSTKKIENKNTVEKISREQILTREEIEKLEVENFLEVNTVNADLKSVGGNVNVGRTIQMDLSIEKRSGKRYKWMIPSPITFEIDEKVATVFPKKILSLQGIREVKISWVKTGNTKLKVKFGSKVVSSFDIKVVGKWETIEPASAKIYSSATAYLGENKTGLVLFKDNGGKRMINLDYSWEYTLASSSDSEFCLKTWSLKDIKKIYKRKCSEDEFQDSLEFSYEDTVGGILIFEYKTLDDKDSLKVEFNDKKKTLDTKKITAKAPKWVDKNYYSEEIVSLLKDGVVTGINKWYFLENRSLSQKDANLWIQNTLEEMKEVWVDTKTLAQIDANLASLKKERVSSADYLTRKDFLEKAHENLVFGNTSVTPLDYKDLTDQENLQIAYVFDENTSWKDKFGENYYRPNVNIKRSEWAYLLSKFLDKNKQVFLTLR